MAGDARPKSHPASPEIPRVGSPLDEVNDRFHDAYDAARAHEEARDAPIMVVVADALVVFRRGERRDVAVTPPLAHLLKSAAHAPLAAFASLHDGGGLPIEISKTFARRLVEKIDESLATLAALPELEGEPDDEARAAREAMRDVLTTTRGFVERASPGGGGASATASAPEELATFARGLGDRLFELTVHSTRVQLRALHAAVEEVLAGFTPEERKSLEVVVTGDHQARVRSLPMQYFQKRFDEEEGDEKRVTYAEGVTDPGEARALVGKRRLDVAIASAFFGDPHRLQRDILGDAAKELLAATELERIE